MTEREAYIALNMMDRVGPVRARSMAAEVGSVQAIFEAGPEDLARANGIGLDLAKSVVEQCKSVNPAAEEKAARGVGARIVAFCDSDYPEPLKSIYDPPLALYVRGTWEPKDKHAVAMVGTRRATHYGATVADRMSYQLARVGFTVISGLARGIDTAAHRGALKGGGRTIAVLGSALDRLYPPENEALSDDIARCGAVISEFTMGREPDRTTFPYRNRIVSGMSMGVVVVEAAMGSGALQTADQALEQGRAVFAVPGRIDAAGSKGPHRLLKNGARLAEDVDDVIQEFEFLIPPEKKAQTKQLDSRPAVQLGAEEQAIVKALWGGSMDLDSLARGAEMNVAKVSSLLIGLEMKRVVRMLPGRIVELADGLKTEAGAGEGG